MSSCPDPLARQQMPNGTTQPPERLARDRRLRRGVVDSERRERVDHRARAELILDREPHRRRVAAGALTAGDNCDGGARTAVLLFRVHGAGDRRCVAQAPEQHDDPGCRHCARGGRSDEGPIDRHGPGAVVEGHGVVAGHGPGAAVEGHGVVEGHGQAAGDSIRHRRRESQHIDDDHDVGGCEALETLDALLEAHLIPGLIEGGVLTPTA